MSGHQPHSSTDRLFPTFPTENEEVTEGLRSYESTRCPYRPANSFMVSVTDPVGARPCVLGSFRVNST
ncbi:hypothetical protein C6376_30215 [Streptomyces sp. P3]|nr:hypothetical protein C6376_30215 [Streptomyces sp. P3]